MSGPSVRVMVDVTGTPMTLPHKQIHSVHNVSRRARRAAAALRRTCAFFEGAGKAACGQLAKRPSPTAWSARSNNDPSCGHVFRL